MDRTYIKDQMIRVLCKGFQSVWLIKLADLSMEIFTSDNSKALPKSIDTVKLLNNYDDARTWYIKNCIVEHSRERVLEQSAVDYILSELKSDAPFYVEYSRINGAEVNLSSCVMTK